jgi:hypothetical protein
MISFTRARAASEDVLCVIATRDDAEIYEPDARAYQYRHKADLAPGEYWYAEDFQISVQDVALFADSENAGSAPYFVLLSSEGDAYHFAEPVPYLERIEGAGTSAPDSRFYGKMLSLSQIGGRLYASGTGGQVYVRNGKNRWEMVSNTFLFDPGAEKKREAGETAAGLEEPKFGSPEWQERLIKKALNPASRNILFRDIAGLSEEDIYLCGEEGPGTKPILFHWNGMRLEELKVPLPESALTGIHIENSESVWVCGREGVILHGSRNRGFTPVFATTRLNLFHHMTPYRGKLVLPASIRPGGLWQLDPKTGDFGHFEPRLPPLTKPPKGSDEPHGGPFFAQAIGDVLWVVAPRDIYRFDGGDWQRIIHPDMP